MRTIMAGTLVGMFGWLVATTIHQETGSAALAALTFGLTGSLIVWGCEIRNQLDKGQK